MRRLIAAFCLVLMATPALALSPKDEVRRELEKQGCDRSTDVAAAIIVQQQQLIQKLQKQIEDSQKGGAKK